MANGIQKAAPVILVGLNSFKIRLTRGCFRTRCLTKREDKHCPFNSKNSL